MENINIRDNINKIIEESVKNEYNIQLQEKTSFKYKNEKTTINKFRKLTRYVI